MICMVDRPEGTVYTLYDEKYHGLLRIKASDQKEAENKAYAWLRGPGRAQLGLSAEETDAAIDDGAFFVQEDDTPEALI
jgi:hypothetical protein